MPLYKKQHVFYFFSKVIEKNKRFLNLPSSIWFCHLSQIMEDAKAKNPIILQALEIFPSSSAKFRRPTLFLMILSLYPFNLKIPY